jgi:hypothetical protein
MTIGAKPMNATTKPKKDEPVKSEASTPNEHVEAPVAVIENPEDEELDDLVAIEDVLTQTG